MAKIRETDVKDSRGEIVISPGLKVRHKDSQFEYTVDSVVQDDSGEIRIVLNLPDEPRFEPTQSSEKIIGSSVYIDSTVAASPAAPSPKAGSSIIYEVDPTAVYYEPDDQAEDEEGQSMISVPQKEFEQEYEVK